MLQRWPIRDKLLVGVGLLAVIVVVLAASGLSATRAYRDLVRSLRARSEELPIAAELAQRIGDVRTALERLRTEVYASPTRSVASLTIFETQELGSSVRNEFRDAGRLAEKYAAMIDSTEGRALLGDRGEERRLAEQLQRKLKSAIEVANDQYWVLGTVDWDRLVSDAEELQTLAARLPSGLHQRFLRLSDEVRSTYRTLMLTVLGAGVAAVAMFVVFVALGVRWVFRPLRVLIKASRRVAAGDFEHTVHLDARDEMAELAGAMNAMTTRFREIRDDLDRQVQERTREVIRSEQLASVGFLAAGVAHEINNPLASIAMSAESLESRLEGAAAGETADVEFARKYLRLIQEEAFRCKGITDGLLDFSRLGDRQAREVDLREITTSVVGMVQRLGKYRDKELQLAPGAPVWTIGVEPELKQVLLNLATNALESVPVGGCVRVQVREQGESAEVVVVDDGCGMTDEVKRHLFEPFFTRRGDGQGVGLGLSITYRIVEEHHGTITATSDGPGCGSKFCVRLPRRGAATFEGRKEPRDAREAA